MHLRESIKVQDFNIIFLATKSIPDGYRLNEFEFVRRDVFEEHLESSSFLTNIIGTHYARRQSIA